jgi:hypothetical protein
VLVATSSMKRKVPQPPLEDSGGEFADSVLYEETECKKVNVKVSCRQLLWILCNPDRFEQRKSRAAVKSSQRQQQTTQLSLTK